MDCDVETPHLPRLEAKLAGSSGCGLDRPRSGENRRLPDHISSELTRIVEDIRRTLLLNPEAARPAALRLVRLLAPAPKDERSNPRGGLAPWQKRKIERYVRERLDRPLQVEELAAQLSLSATYFTRTFKKTFGEPPHAYLVRLRLESAQKLMLSTGEDLSQIALACGFSDQSHFSKSFRRGVGESPNAWRRRNLTEAQAEAIGRVAIGAN